MATNNSNNAKYSKMFNNQLKLNKKMNATLETLDKNNEGVVKAILKITDEGRDAVMSALSKEDKQEALDKITRSDETGMLLSVIDGKITLSTPIEVGYREDAIHSAIFASPHLTTAEDAVNEIMDKGFIVLHQDEELRKKSEENEYTVKIRKATEHFATYCYLPISYVVIDSNKRHQHLAAINETLMAAMSLLKSKGGIISADEDRYYKIEDIHKEVSKEMDIIIEKMDMIKIITNNNIMSEERVSPLYRKFRGVTEDPTEDNIKIQEGYENV